MEPYELLSTVLSYIEQNLNSKLNISLLANKFNISDVHLQRIFKFTFNIPIISYIRSRKIASSINFLLNTNMNVIDIAYEYGFEHEQTYIRAFKREYNVTPGEVRKNRTILKIIPPFNLINSNKLDNGMLSYPDIVIVPKFFVIGKLHKVNINKSSTLAPMLAKDFFFNEREKIQNQIHPEIYIGLTTLPEVFTDWTYYLPSVQVKNLKNIPDGFSYYKFETSICAKFKYIGKHSYLDINSNVARKMYNSIFEFFNKQTKYKSDIHLHFEKIDTSLNDDNYCLMEWFAPLIEK